MDLAEAKAALAEVEKELDGAPVVLFRTFDTPHGSLSVYLTGELRRRCRKGRVWKAHGMLATLKNAAYGFDPLHSRSRGGSDGIFKLDRDHRPKNSMMKKLFDRFLDRPSPLLAVLEQAIGSKSDTWIPVRLVSHHMRLLGVLDAATEPPRLVLVDYDDEES